nr:GNAT family N-acetyltransferase [Lysinibacillus timonensis]
MEFTLVELNPQHYAFEYKKDGEKLAEIEWVQNGSTMVMNHTYVSDTLRGQGVAKKLLDHAVNYARDNNYKMEAVCSYVVAVFNKSNEYDDVKA